MSKLSRTHYEIARHVRWHARLLTQVDFPGLDYEVNGGVQRYHRNDGYREVKVVARNERFLKELDRIVQDFVEKQAYASLRIHREFSGSARHPSEKIWNVSIWC